MARPPNKPINGVALALSGGGFRATLFHVGALWRLNELAMLRGLARVSSVSGGSITAGWLGAQWGEFEWSEDVASNFEDAIAKPLRRFCSLDIDKPAIAEGVINPLRSAADAIADAYRKHLFGDRTLQDLPDGPRFVINATNLQTGRLFRFSKPFAADYLLGKIPNPTFDLAVAVAASSAFPPYLSPVKLPCVPEDFEPLEGANLHGDPEFCKNVLLTDGGVYDNLGLETAWRYSTVLVSDAGAPFTMESKLKSDWLNQTLRAFEVTMDQGRALRKRQLISSLQAGRTGAYWGIGSRSARYPSGGSLEPAPGTADRMAAIRTRLNPFSAREQEELINWGYVICDSAVQSHLGPANGAAAAWPYPDHALT